MATHATPPALPTHAEIRRPLLELLKRKREVSLVEALGFIAKRFKLTKSQLERKQGCGKETVLQNRLRWARWELQSEGVVETTRRGFFRLK